MGDVSPLGNSKARIARAIYHFRELERKYARRSEKSKTVTFRQKFHPNTNMIVVEVDRVPRYPVGWAFLVSESLFNLRAALDYLVWDLSIWNLEQNGETREPFERTQYPIATLPSRFHPWQIKDVHPSDLAFIEQLQPYGQVFMAQFAPILKDFPDIEPLTRKHPLATLARLNDHDKHRTLRPAAFGSVLRQIGEAEGIDCEIVHRNYFLTDFGVGTQSAEFRVVPRGPNPEVKVNDRVYPGIGVDRLEFLRGFPGMQAFVADLVRDFTPVFTEGRHPAI